MFTNDLSAAHAFLELLLLLPCDSIDTNYYLYEILCYIWSTYL